MKGLSFDELFPGKYLKATDFKGKPATLTIKSVTRPMLSDGSGGESPAVSVQFQELEKILVLNKTNGVCLRAMWGDYSGEWVGHKVTLHPVHDDSGMSDSGLCIRVKGSPELDNDLKFKAHVGLKVIVQKLVPTGNGSAPETVVEPETGEVLDLAGDDDEVVEAVEEELL